VISVPFSLDIRNHPFYEVVMIFFALLAATMQWKNWSAGVMEKWSNARCGKPGSSLVFQPNTPVFQHSITGYAADP
jgi:hypothetical protein